MQTFAVIYILAAVTTSMLCLAAGWRSTAIASTRMKVPSCAGLSATWTAMRSFADIDAELAVALQRLALVLTRRLITLDVAVKPDLLTQLTRPGLTVVIEQLVTALALYGPAERLMLTAWESDGRIAVRVIDDVIAANLDVRRTLLLGLAGRVDECGGTFDFAVEAEGSAVTIWLPNNILVT